MRGFIRLRGIGLCMVMFAAGCSEPAPTRPPAAALLTEAPVQQSLAIEAPVPGAAMPRRLFLSGHSLTDRPLTDYLAVLADRAGTPLHWERQERMDAPIRMRSPAPIPPGKFDALLITEMHSVLQTLMWNDTERHLREYHDAFLSLNPSGRTYFYVPWISIVDKADPRDWIAYEEAAAFVWQCVISRVNAGIAATGRSDRIVTIPASLAMAFLVARLESGATLPGLQAASLTGSIDLFLADEVHLTPLGFFYMALINYIALSGIEPGAVQLPGDGVIAGVSLQQAQTLLAIAGEFFASRATNRTALSATDCRRFLEQSFIDDYWDYGFQQLLLYQGRAQSRLRIWYWKWLFARYFRGW